ncbi:MAG TPA: hypothetical protein VFE03_09735, partial [Caulobacteraceae bacterium]|nr:hypothetical protein [Caulobacteraceae bacterium]
LRAKLEDEKRKALIAAAAAPAAPAPAAPAPPPAPVGKGFLKTDVSWQPKFFPRPQSALDYFLKHT